LRLAGPTRVGYSFYAVVASGHPVRVVECGE